MPVLEALLAALSLTVPCAEVVPCGASGTIPITVVRSWQAPYAQQILDLSMICMGDLLAFRSTSEKKIYFANPDDGDYQGETNIPGDCTGFGFAMRNDSHYYISDESDGTIRHSTGIGGWGFFDNPAPSEDGGLAWDPYGEVDLLLEASSTGGDDLYVFDIYGDLQFSCGLPGITGTISGMAPYPLATSDGSRMPSGLLVTCWDNPTFYFYTYTGTGFTLYAQEPCPVYVIQSLGLVYMPNRGTFYWSYRAPGGSYWVSELYIPILGDLESTTWGAIKATAGVGCIFRE